LASSRAETALILTLRAADRRLAGAVRNDIVVSDASWSGRKSPHLLDYGLWRSRVAWLLPDWLASLEFSSRSLRVTNAPLLPEHAARVAPWPKWPRF